MYSAEQILTQQVYQILAGYPDGNDAQLLRDDPLFKTIVGIDPRETERSLASGSTLNRFQHAFTRREAHKPPEERDVIFEVRRAQIERINATNEFTGLTWIAHGVGFRGWREDAWWDFWRVELSLGDPGR